MVRVQARAVGFQPHLHPLVRQTLEFAHPKDTLRLARQLRHAPIIRDRLLRDVFRVLRRSLGGILDRISGALAGLIPIRLSWLVLLCGADFYPFTLFLFVYPML